MPCYEVRTMNVEFKVENRRLLDDAIRASGLQVTDKGDRTITFEWGEIVLDLKAGTAVVADGSQGRLNELKRAYSKECVKAAAKKMWWGVKLQGNQATVTKVKW
jgi:hypothetical protein